MISDEQLSTLIHSLFGAAHARTTETGQYFIANQEHATNHGFTDIDASLGINYEEMRQHRRQQLNALEGSLVLEDQHARLITDLNWQADHSKEPISSSICTLFPTGCIHAGLLTKIPIFGHQQKVVAVLTFFEDKTSEVNLFTLYCLYKKHYPVQQAIFQFLKYLNIKKYFKKLPTNQELIILLTLRKNAASKYAAKVLGINYRTVEEYKARLRNKLIFVTLENLLIFLRMPHQRLFTDSNNISDNVESLGR